MHSGLLLCMKCFSSSNVFLMPFALNCRMVKVSCGCCLVLMVGEGGSGMRRGERGGGECGGEPFG